MFHTFVKSIPEDYLYTDDSDHSYGRESNPHVTILYGLENENDYEKIKNNPIIYKRPPIHLTLGRIIRFSNPDVPYDVLVSEVNSIALTLLHYYLEMHYDNQNTFPNYRPHSTIAYVKKGMGKEFEGKWDLQGRRVVADKFWFTTKNEEMKEIRIGR